MCHFMKLNVTFFYNGHTMMKDDKMCVAWGIDIGGEISNIPNADS